MSWDIQVWLVGSKAPFLGLPDLVILWGKIFLDWLYGICLCPRVNLQGKGFGSCFTMSWSVVKNAVWPSGALYVSRVPSLGRDEVMLSEYRGCGGIT